MTIEGNDAADTLLRDITLAGLPREELAEWLRAMELIREFERVSSRLSLDGKILAACTHRRVRKR